MAGITDRPFRQLCRRMGAGLAVSEMMVADPNLRHTRKSKLRMDHRGEDLPIAVQIAGSDPELLASAARFNVRHGAQIIDINMGCPAKKVCNKAAGSALLKDEKLVGKILETVVNAVQVPVTLKIRTGWSTEHRNGPAVARIAESCGIQALAVHGRTKACKFNGNAEYDTIAEIKNKITIPVFANGDITSPEQAHDVLAHTKADGLMIGRAAQGKPWLFREINHYLTEGSKLPRVSITEMQKIMLEHVRSLHHFYGQRQGLRIARKHVAWYLSGSYPAAAFKTHFNKIEDACEQLAALQQVFRRLADEEEEIAA
jgi:tRNA-dihydrouridine synthase B